MFELHRKDMSAIFLTNAIFFANRTKKKTSPSTEYNLGLAQVGDPLFLNLSVGDVDIGLHTVSESSTPMSQMD